MLILDNGSEFISMALGVGLRARHRTAFHRAGKPNQNAYVESFNGRLHDECLNEHWFMSLGQARETIETWRLDYNWSARSTSAAHSPFQVKVTKVGWLATLPFCWAVSF